MNGFTQEHKKEVEWKLIDAITEGLKTGVIKESDLPTIASYILDSIKNVTNHEQLLQFLRDLSAKWNIFSPVLVAESGEVREKKEDQTFEKVLTLAKENKVEEAIALAKTATEAKQAQQLT